MVRAHSTPANGETPSALCAHGEPPPSDNDGGCRTPGSGKSAQNTRRSTLVGWQRVCDTQGWYTTAAAVGTKMLLGGSRPGFLHVLFLTRFFFSFNVDSYHVQKARMVSRFLIPPENVLYFTGAWVGFFLFTRNILLKRKNF